MMQQFILELAQGYGIKELPAWVMLLVSSLNVVLIVVLALIARRVLRRLLGAAHARWIARTPGLEERKRIETLNRIAGYIISVIIGVVTVMLVLAELGISIAPLLATAGVVGIAVSFGAQSLVKDYFTGFVMLLENQIRQGDFIEVAGKAGSVEEVTLRYVRLRDGEGAVHFIPNSSITSVTNNSREFAFAVIEVGVSYNTNIGQAYDVIKTVGEKIKQDPAFATVILGDLDIQGVNQLADSAVTIRMRMKVAASDKFALRRALLREIKEAFDAAGIEIPFPQRVVHMAPQSNQS